MKSETESKSISSMFRPEIVAMKPYVPGEQPQAGKAIKLNTNENPYPPSTRVVEAIQHAAANLQRYPDPLGTAFRIAASELLDVEPDMILCGNGSDDILTILTRAFVGEREQLRLPYPSYILYRTLAELQGANFEEIAFEEDWSLSARFFENSERLKLIYLPNPNSPTGTVVSHEQILQLANSVDCPVVIDEAYVDFASQHCVSLISQNPRIIVTRTLSKSYALAGLRFGYMVAHPDIVRTLRSVKDSYNTDMLSIAGATAAISDQAWLRENVAQVIATRERMKVALEEMTFRVLPSQANFLWCVHPSKQHRTMYEQLKKYGILVRYMDYGTWGDGLRISVGNDKDINAMLQILKMI